MTLSLLRVGGEGEPANIALLTTWQVLVESYKITGLNNNDPVAQWDDVSGNARHLVEATNRPLYIAAPANLSCPAVRFDGVNDKLECATAVSAFVSGTVCTAFVAGVFRGSAPAANERMAVWRQNSQANDFDNPGSHMLNAQSSTTIRTYRNNSGTSSGTMPAVNAPFIASIVYNGTTVQLFLNGVARPTGANAGTFAIDRMLVGCGRTVSTYSEFCQVDMVMSGITNTALDSAIRSQIEGAVLARMI